MTTTQNIADAGFAKAFTLAMQSEIGAWFNPNDPATQQGLIDTPAHRRACGYCNIPGDAGGETKFGIAQNANRDVVVRTLTLAQAQNIYFIKYWLASQCDKIGTPLSAIHFDAAVNMGVGRAAKFLQTSVGVKPDGAIGAQTLAAIAKCPDLKKVCTQYLAARQSFYDSIVLNNPTQAKFAKGWANRIKSLSLWLSTQ